jgi:hypothetical protein
MQNEAQPYAYWREKAMGGVVRVLYIRYFFAR